MRHWISFTAFLICSISIIALHAAGTPNRTDYILKQQDLEGVWRVKCPSEMIYYYVFIGDDIFEYTNSKTTDEETEVLRTYGKIICVEPRRIIASVYSTHEKGQFGEFPNKYVIRYFNITKYDKLRKYIEFTEDRLYIYDVVNDVVIERKQSENTEFIYKVENSR